MDTKESKREQRRLDAERRNELVLKKKKRARRFLKAAAIFILIISVAIVFTSNPSREDHEKKLHAFLEIGEKRIANDPQLSGFGKFIFKLFLSKMGKSMMTDQLEYRNYWVYSVLIEPKSGEVVTRGYLGSVSLAR